MKCIVVILLLVFAVSNIYSQQTNPSPVLNKKDYLKKSKNQKLAAWLFLTGGGTAIALGAKDVDPQLGNSDKSRSATLIVVGIAALSVSTTLFIASARNKHKSEALSFKMERAPIIQQGSFAYKSFPAVSLRLRL